MQYNLCIPLLECNTWSGKIKMQHFMPMQNQKPYGLKLSTRGGGLLVASLQ